MSTKHLLTFKNFTGELSYYAMNKTVQNIFQRVNKKKKITGNQICFINRGLNLCLPFSSCCISSLEWRFLPSPVGLDVPELPVSSPVSASLSGTNNC